MEDPVFATDGHSYERKEIARWLGSGKRTSPLTNDELPDTVLRPNHSLRSQIAEWQGRSNAQWIATMFGEIGMADEPEEVERKLAAFARFVQSSRAVVQPPTLAKLRGMLAGSPAAVQQSLRAVEAECELVVAGIAARLRDEQRDQGLAKDAVLAGKGKLAALDMEIVATEERLTVLTKQRERRAEEVAGLEKVEAACAAAAEQVRSYFLVFVPTIREIRDFYREM
eukprot:SAG31_NODE_13905_length_838_cov_1.450609_1_plen_226_part_00